MIKTSQDRQPGLGTSGISGVLTLTKTGTTARTATFPDAAITVAGSAAALTSGRVPFVTTGGLLTDNGGLLYAVSTTHQIDIGDGSLGATARINGAAATARDVRMLTNGANRWLVRCSATAESGSSAGSDFQLLARDDAGNAIDTTFQIIRAAGGAITLARPTTISGTLSATSLTATGLTSGRVPFATTGGLLTDSALMLFASAQITLGDNTTAGAIVINGASGATKAITTVQRAGVTAWGLFVRDATDDYRIRAYDDAGTAIDYPMTIARAALGAISFTRPITSTSTLSATSLTATGLTSGRVPFVTTGGLLADSSGLTYSVNTLRVGTDVDSYSYHVLNGAAAAQRGVYIRTASVERWRIESDTVAESGSDAGCGLRIAYTDAGAAIDSPISIVRAAGGAITLARPVVVTGTNLTVPNGTAAAPGIRLTGEATGLYRIGSTKIGISVGGVAALGLEKPGSGYGGGFQLLTQADADYTYIYGDRTNAEMRISAGSASDNGGTIRLYGTTHTTASTGRLYSTSNIRFSWDGTGIGFFGATPVARPSLAAATGTATRTTFDTTTVTLPQLAERVKAMIDDLRAYGLEA